MLTQKIQDALVALLLSQPFYAHVLYEMQLAVDRSVPTACVTMDLPVQMLMNDRYFNTLSTREATGVMKHEVMHLIFEHLLRRENRDPHLWNLAADLAINQLLKPDELPSGAVTLDSMQELVPERLPARAAAEVYYDILNKHAVKVSVTIDLGGGGEQGDGEDDGPGITVTVTDSKGNSRTFKGIDDHSREGKAGEGEVSRELVQEMVRQIVESAVKKCGNVPGELSAAVEAMRKHKVNWRRELQRFLTGRGKMIASPCYLRESKRFDDFPGRRKTMGMEALVAIDTSGSMSDDDLRDTLGQLLQIKKVSGTRILVVWGDIRHCGGPIPIERVKGDLKLKGRGGTDLCWPFDMATRMRIPTVVYFTDGYGPAPPSVPQRVLWVITGGGRKPADYGYTVYLEKEE